MAPASCMARTLPRVAGTFTTSIPVALVKGSKIAFTLASSYDPPMVRMMTLPAALDRRVQMNGAAVARPAPATKVRREILIVRSVMSWPPAPGGVRGALSFRVLGRVVGTVGGKSLVTRDLRHES